MKDSSEQIVDSAFAAFALDAAAPPPLTLRGANAVDSYNRPSPFDAAHDQVDDDYLEGYGFWGIGYLDSRSWRHYLPHLIAYAMRHPDDPHMVIEALVRSFRPPDRYPPRLATLSAEQEAAVTAFLEHIAFQPEWEHVREDAQQALEEWWLPNPRSRPTAAEIAALRAVPMTYRTVGQGIYRLEVPDTLTGSGLKDIPEESRTIETWGGYLCGDAETLVAVNVTPSVVRSLDAAVAVYRPFFSAVVSDEWISVPGATTARRLSGLNDATSPGEPQTFAMILASNREAVVTLSVRSWPREDVQQAVGRIVSSFRLITVS